MAKEPQDQVPDEPPKQNVSREVAMSKKASVGQIVMEVNKLLAEEAEELDRLPPLTEDEQAVFDRMCGKEFLERLFKGEVRQAEPVPISTANKEKAEILKN